MVNIVLEKYGVAMVAAPLPSPSPNFRGGLKISDQNNWRGPDQKIKFFGGRELNFRGGGSMKPNDVMVVVLKDILLYLLGFRFIYIVSIS